MNADERTPGQQGYGQQSPQQEQGQQAQSQQQQQPTMSDQDQGGSMATGQAAYGNSGQADTLSQNSSSMGQGADFGQTGSQSNQGTNDSSLFRGGSDDTGSGGISSQQGSGDQSFADQGQGAMNEDLMGSSDDGTTDIEIERSHGRESDVEGKNF